MEKFDLVIKPYASEPYVVRVESKDVLALVRHTIYVTSDLYGHGPKSVLFKPLAWLQLEHQMRESFGVQWDTVGAKTKATVLGFDAMVCDEISSDIVLAFAPDMANTIYARSYFKKA